MEFKCDFCGKAFEKYESQMKGKQHHFCSRACLASFRKAGGYPAVKHPHLSEYNRLHNAERMTPEVREKLSRARLDTGSADTYRKKNGRHEHRTAAEQILGRPLRKGEVVHHINRDKRDNRPENLMIFPNQAEHARWHKEHDGREVMTP